MRLPISEKELGLVITSNEGKQAFFLPVDSGAYEFYYKYRNNYLTCTYVEFKQLYPIYLNVNYRGK